MTNQTVGRWSDIAMFLYAAPFIVNFVWALYLWAGSGLTSILPQLVFLEVTQNPYVFLAGFGAVALAALMDFNTETPDKRKASLSALSKRLQAIAVLSTVLALIAAWYAAGFDLGTTLFNLLDARYPLVFPALLVFLSFVILPPVKLQGANRRNALVVLLLLASPLALYELGKRSTVLGLGMGLVLLLAAAFLLLSKNE